MVLIIGGRNQGKSEYAKNILKIEDITLGEKIDFNKPLNYKCINNLNLLIRNMIEQNCTNQQIYTLINNINCGCVICDEVGSGLVSIDYTERRYVEITGRVCCMLAQKSHKVIRVFAGIPTVIKG